MTKRGRYDPDLTGVDDDTGHSVDYDGGLQAVAEGGRIAVLHGHGTGNTDRPSTSAQKQPPPDIDSPFLGLVGSDAPAPHSDTQATHSGANGHQPDVTHLAGGGHVTGVYTVPPHHVQPVIEPT